MGSESGVMRLLLILFASTELGWWGYDLQGFELMAAFSIVPLVIWFGFPARAESSTWQGIALYHIGNRWRLILELIIFIGTFIAAQEVHSRWIAYAFAVLICGMAIEKRRYIIDQWNSER